MNNNLENFKEWFKKPLETLYDDIGAGFIIVMISLPLIERYLREKIGIHEHDLNENFYKKLVDIFPTLIDESNAKDFWIIYRHGLLHQASLRIKIKKEIMSVAVDNRISSEILCGYNSEGKTFLVSPNKFSQKIIQIIENDFETFEGLGSIAHPLPLISERTGASGFSKENS